MDTAPSQQRQEPLIFSLAAPSLRGGCRLEVNQSERPVGGLADMTDTNVVVNNATRV